MSFFFCASVCFNVLCGKPGNAEFKKRDPFDLAQTEDSQARAEKRKKPTGHGCSDRRVCGTLSFLIIMVGAWMLCGNVM